MKRKQSEAYILLYFYVVFIHTMTFHSHNDGVKPMYL
jgi:hypothetical protein